MSSSTGEWCCTECGSYNAYQEDFNDDEVGHIMGCEDCGYYDVYREDAETGEIIEEYAGFDHEYAQDDKEKTMSEKYIYEVSESSVDVRSWTIESDRKLTEEEVSDIYQDSQIDDEGKEHQYSDGITITYDGTEYGDDAQPLLKGDFKYD